MVLAGLDSYGQRVDESTRFMNWGFRAWQSQPLLTKGEKIADARVQLGSEDKVGLVAPRDIAVTIPAGISRGNMSVKVVYDGPVKAPLKAGQHIANLVGPPGDTQPHNKPLLAAHTRRTTGFLDTPLAGPAKLLRL